jgi:hypothetical protein
MIGYKIMTNEWQLSCVLGLANYKIFLDTNVEVLDLFR